MPEPGWIPPYTADGPPDDCMRMAFSCVTGVHPRRLRYIAPADDKSNHQFWKEWRVLALQRGFKLTLVLKETGIAHPHPWPFGDDELWIAGVPSFHWPGEGHAIVMRGQQLHYDPSDTPRSRRPTKVESGWRVTRRREP